MARRLSLQIAGVIAENTFTSIADMVNHLFPVLKPFKWFLTMHFESVKLAPVLKQPVLLISVRIQWQESL